MFAVVVPVYNNAASLPDLLKALGGVNRKLRELGTDARFVFVVDGSPDNSAEVLREHLPNCDFESELVMHARNFGSFAAIRTGLASVDANYYGMVAADLQEPPELLIRFYEALSGHRHDVAIGVRESREDPGVSKAMSGLFWSLYRRLIIPHIPKGGVDLFACTATVRNELLQFSESHSSLVAQLFWLGFSRVEVPYVRRARTHGKSAWSLSKKIRYMMDSVFAFTDIPVRLITIAGLLAMTLSFVYGAFVFFARTSGGIADPGFAATIISILFMGGLNAFALGIVGNYAWRTFENSKQRPLSIVARRIKYGTAQNNKNDLAPHE